MFNLTNQSWALRGPTLMSGLWLLSKQQQYFQLEALFDLE